ncbi:MAG: hypothetical protein QG635_2219 [Bacteroidota bacterium]|nr:hypothetical protein [Bacteroidota bacterium]
MKILIDMNLSPKWVDVFKANNYEAVHWSSIGENSAPDEEIFKYAKENGYIIFTSDLDFSKLLYLSNNYQPSVIQVRSQDLRINALKNLVLSMLTKYSGFLEQGAIVILNKDKIRARILPLN